LEQANESHYREISRLCDGRRVRFSYLALLRELLSRIGRFTWRHESASLQCSENHCVF
jgi:hypothetical protein